MITLMRLHAAASRRLHRARAEGERGFVLVYVLLVTMLISMMVATVSVATAGNVVPAQRSAYSEAATAAAQGGIQAYLAELTQASACKSLPMLQFNAAACAGLTQGSSSGRTKLISADADHAFGTGNQAYYTWTVLAVTPQFVRVRSVGEIGNPGSGLYTQKVLTADIDGGDTRNFGAYAYYSTYETLASAKIGAEFGPRTITLDDRDTIVAAGLDLTKVPPGTAVTWSGVPNTGNVGSQWCDALWYTPAEDKSPNAATGGNGRFSQQSGLPDGYNWQETASAPASMAGTQHNGICQVEFSTGNRITGPAYSMDAFLLSNGTQNGQGPQFDMPTYTAWDDTSAPVAPAGAAYRTFPVIGGTTKDGLNAPQSASFPPLQLPDSVDGAIGNNSATQLCQYWGPTRIWVQGATAYITSPMTKADPSSACYLSNPLPGQVASTVPTGLTTEGSTLPGAGTPSVLRAEVPVADTLIYVHDAELASAVTWNGQPIFQVSGPAGSGTQLSQTATTATTATATGRWTSNCDGWLLGWLLCDQSGKNQAYFEKEVAKFSDFTKQVINADGTLKGTPTASLTADLQANLVTAFSGYGKTLYTPDSPAPTPTGDNQVAYRVAFNPAAEPALATVPPGCTTGTPTTAADGSVAQPPVNDPILGTRVQATVTTQVDCAQKQVTATVRRMTSTQDTCKKWVLLVCTGGWTYKWTDDQPQFDIAATRKVTTTTKTVATSSSASFPLPNDVTRYQSKLDGPGDAYVEGTVNGKLSVVAEHDIVVTGNLTYADPTTNGTALVAHDNVRVYHPVGCTDTTAGATTPGYCPNDTTGLFDPQKLWFSGTNFGYHPSRQYTNLSRNSAEPAPMTNLDVSAAVYALHGSFVVDNYNRGEGRSPDGTYPANGLQTLTLFGGVYQLHHGAAGVQWEIGPTATTRPTSGYTAVIKWDEGLQDRSLPYLPDPAGGNAADPWRVISTSVGGGSP
jgi:hypothetical protein